MALDSKIEQVLQHLKDQSFDCSATALKCLSSVDSQQYVGKAQAYATVALVYEQRIANLLVVNQHLSDPTN